MSKLLKRIAGLVLTVGLLTVCFGVTGNLFRVWGATRVTKIYLAGDSTVKTYGPAKMMGGWGEYLQDYFNAKNVNVINKAEGGRSSRSFINQGRLREILALISAGDYLFIQFGHNDEASEPEYELERATVLGAPDEQGVFPVLAGQLVETPPKLLKVKPPFPYGRRYYPYSSGTFKWYLKQYIDGAREKGAIPVLVTPVSRRYFAGGRIAPHHGQNDAYVTAVVQLAKEMRVDYIDLFARTKAMYEKAGEKGSERYQAIKPTGILDNTHYNKYGAFVVAEMVAEAVREKGWGIAKDLVIPAVTVAPPEEKGKHREEKLL